MSTPPDVNNPAHTQAAEPVLSPDDVLRQSWDIGTANDCEPIWDASVDQWWAVWVDCAHGRFAGYSAGPIDISTAFRKAFERFAGAHIAAGGGGGDPAGTPASQCVCVTTNGRCLGAAIAPGDLCDYCVRGRCRPVPDASGVPAGGRHTDSDLRCICGPLASRDGEDIDERPDCPVHGDPDHRQFAENEGVPPW